MYIHLYSPSKVANKYKIKEKNLTNYSYAVLNTTKA